MSSDIDSIESVQAHPPQVALNYRWIAFGLLSASHMLMAMCSYVWSPMAPMLRGELGIDNSGLGMIVSVMYLVMVMVSTPSGIFADRYGVRRMLFVSNLLVGCGLLLLPAASAYHWLVAASVLIGSGYGMINQITTKGIISWFDASARGTIMGFKQMGVTAGGGLVGLYIPFLSLQMGWRMAILFLGLAVVGMSALSIGFYREHATGGGDVGHHDTGERNSFKDIISSFLATRELLVVTALAAGLSFCQASFTAFIVVYAQEAFRLSMVLAGSLLTIAMVGGTVARLFVGIWSDRWLAGNRVIPLALLSFVGAAASLTLALQPNGAPVSAVFLLAALMGIAFLGWNSICMVLIAEIVDTRHAGSMLGIILTIAWVAMVLGPAFFGRLADHVGYLAGWILVSVVSGVSCCGFVFLCRKPVVLG
jgi:MFS family permease